MNKIDYAKISSQNVKELLFRHKISIRQLAENINIPPTTLNDSLKSKKGIPIAALIKIAEFFHLTVNDLCDETFFKNPDSEMLQSDVVEFINKYKALDKHGKELIGLIIDKELERAIEEKSNYTKG